MTIVTKGCGRKGSGKKGSGNTGIGTEGRGNKGFGSVVEGDDLGFFRVTLGNICHRAGTKAGPYA
jgi:hypothetical protein